MSETLTVTVIVNILHTMTAIFSISPNGPQKEDIAECRLSIAVSNRTVESWFLLTATLREIISE